MGAVIVPFGEIPLWGQILIAARMVRRGAVANCAVEAKKDFDWIAGIDVQLLLDEYGGF